MASRSVPTYDCPHCYAKDSTYPCPFRIPSDVRYGYPRGEESKARSVGCRQIHYHDLARGVADATVRT
jgi:hypothetical protein